MTEKPIVFYNGACPICDREIEHYRRLDHAGANALAFADISQPDQAMPKLPLSRDAAKRRLHVLDADGRLLSGIPAFAAIWEHLPRYRWLSTLSRWPVLRSMLPWLYEPIAFCLYRLDKWRRSQAPVAPDAGQS